MDDKICQNLLCITSMKQKLSGPIEAHWPFIFISIQNEIIISTPYLDKMHYMFMTSSNSCLFILQHVQCIFMVFFEMSKRFALDYNGIQVSLYI